MNLEKIIAVRNAKTIYKDGDKCVKVFNENYSKADILNEALNQARVEELDINVPKIKEISMVDGKWAIVTEFIKGNTLAQLMEKFPKKKDEYMAKFVELQLMVQANTCPLLTKLKDKMNRKINLADINATTKYDLHTRLESMPKGNALCHGDFNPSNVIIADDGKAYIIDWSHATQGNPCADAARTYLLFWLSGDLTSAEKYLEVYCEKSNISKKDIQRWLPIVAASQSVKGNEKEREFLLSWVNVVDYE